MSSENDSLRKVSHSLPPEHKRREQFAAAARLLAKHDIKVLDVPSSMITTDLKGKKLVQRS